MTSRLSRVEFELAAAIKGRKGGHLLEGEYLARAQELVCQLDAAGRLRHRPHRMAPTTGPNRRRRPHRR